MRKKLYTLLLFAAFSISAIYAQTGISVGSANGNGTYINATNIYGPMSSISTSGSWNRHAYIYPASLLATIPVGATIDSLFFSRVISAVTAVQGTLAGTVNFKIYLKNTAATAFTATTSWTTETTGSTLAYDGNPTAAVGDGPGFIRFNVANPFVYNGGNLEVLVQYTQTTATTGEVGWGYDNNTSVPDYGANSVAYVSGTTGTPTNTLNTLNLRHPSMLVYYTYNTPVNPGLNFFTTSPNISCHSTGQTLAVQLQNYGTSPIAPGAAAVTLDITGANTFNNTITNTATILPNGTETITFTNINLNTPGNNDYTAYVNMAGDNVQSNDSLFDGGITANNISTFPAVEDVETSLPLLSYVSVVAGDQLWALQDAAADGAYINGDMLDSLYPHGGSNFFFFDSYSLPNSDGVVTRLFSNCVTLTRSVTPTSNSMTFWMSHDTTFTTDNLDDSLYVSISEDKGATWTRIAGYRRLDPAFATPGWKQEKIDLTAFGCKTIQVGFEGVSHFGNIIGLDDVTITSTGDLNCTTPVNLLSIIAQKINKDNKVIWKTSQESNTLKYVVEQSRNGRDFTPIGQVAAAGNSNTERTYSFTHTLPLKGYNYYRVKMVDVDNRFKYSPVRSLNNLATNEITSYPNPVTNIMQVDINAENTEKATVIISDMSGKLIYSKAQSLLQGDNNFKISTTGFTSGTYILKVQMSTSVAVKKFVKL